MLTELPLQIAKAVADCLMGREGLLNRKWSYDYGVVWRGMEQLYALNGDAKYLAYIYDALDTMVDPEGRMAGYSLESHNLDYLCIGRQLLFLYKTLGEEKYLKAAKQLREQLREQPRTSDGGFWHKDVYPYQMWLDGQHMAIPFYIEAVQLMDADDTALVDAASQLLLAYGHTLMPETGLLAHGWDEKRQQIWADPETGRAKHAWGRATGWYMTALADTLELLGREHPCSNDLIGIFALLAGKLLSIREDGVWLQVLDCPGRIGNYAESSGSCLIDYALLKGVRLGFLPKKMECEARRSFEAIVKHFVGSMRDGTLFVAKCCQGAGLGGASGRDGSFDYYISENVVSYDLKATGAFIQAAVEYERGC
ncbi:MAG: glycoside hydrolase family 88 protein [Clostridia bacterium]|nr:glycoside hydrolase family 88 protein [Clostridia bacterium]